MRDAAIDWAGDSAGGAVFCPSVPLIASTLLVIAVRAGKSGLERLDHDPGGRPLSPLGIVR